MDGYGSITEIQIKKLTNSELTLVNKTDNQEIELEKNNEFNLFAVPLWGFFMRKNKPNITLTRKYQNYYLKIIFRSFLIYQAGRIMIA